MNITYTQNGDYLIPNIIIRKTKPLGHYGRLRKAYLEMHRPIPVSYTHLDVYKRQHTDGMCVSTRAAYSLPVGMCR